MKDLIPIDHNVKIPRKRIGSARYNWTGLGIGDSFFATEITDAGLSGSGRKFSSYWGLGWKFETRNLTENGIRGVRIWRVK